MTNKEKILQVLETIHADVQDLKEGHRRLEQGQSRTNTVLKVLEAGQNDIREHMATKADVQDIKAEQTKLKRRIENVEESTKTPNPQKH